MTYFWSINCNIILIIVLQLPYTWNVESNNGIAMKKPELDIPESGWVPSHVQVFRLKLPCTGVVSAEVRVLLTINITAVNPKHGDVSLAFRRNKICLKTTDMLLDSLIGNMHYYITALECQDSEFHVVKSNQGCYVQNTFKSSKK